MRKNVKWTRMGMPSAVPTRSDQVDDVSGVRSSFAPWEASMRSILRQRLENRPGWSMFYAVAGGRSEAEQERRGDVPAAGVRERSRDRRGRVPRAEAASRRRRLDDGA